MTIVNRLLTSVVLSSLVCLSVPVARTVSAADASDKPIEVCKDSNGKVRSGDLDVLLLLDNSKSLNTKVKDKKTGKPKATDPEYVRFEAIDSLLTSLTSLTNDRDDAESLSINFGMVTFGSDARMRIPMQPLTTESQPILQTKIDSTKREEQEAWTDYVKALTTALDVLKDRPTSNCKFLVWFTDGLYAEKPRQNADKQQESDRQDTNLRAKVCGTDGMDGIAKKFQTARINTFVLLLKPKVDEDEPSTLQASLGAMLSITGSSEIPEELGVSGIPGLCGEDDTQSHLGEILVAGDASDIARVITVIAPPPTTAVTECPIRSTGGDLPEMPAARHLSSLTFSAYTDEAELSDLKSLTIKDPDGTTHPATDFFTEGKQGDYQQKFFVKSNANRELDQGWTFSLGGQEVGWCVQADPHQFKVQFAGAEVQQTSTGGELSAADIDSLEYRLDSDRSKVIPVDVARTTPEKVVGFLDIDPTDTVIPEPIQVDVVQSNVLVLSCERFELLDSIGRDMPDSRRIGSRCLVDTTNSQIRDVKVTLEPSQLMKLNQQLSTSGCNSTVGLLQADERAQSPAGPVSDSLELQDNSASSLWVVVEAQGRSAECNVEEDSAVLIEFTKLDEEGSPLQDSKALGVKIQLRWERVPVWWVVVAITVAALLAIAMLVLFILGRLSRATSRLPKPGRMMAYEVPLRIETTRTSGLRALAEDGTELRNHEFAVGSLIRVDVSPSRREARLVGGTRSTLRIKYPSLFRPFDLPQLVLASDAPAEYWPAPDGQGGLSPMASSGVIVHSPRHSAQTTQATATILVPSSGDRATLIKDLLTTKVDKALAPAATGDKWKSPSSSASTSNVSSPRPPTPGSSGAAGGSTSGAPDPVDGGSTPQPRRGPPRIGG